MHHFHPLQCVCTASNSRSQNFSTDPKPATPDHVIGWLGNSLPLEGFVTLDSVGSTMFFAVPFYLVAGRTDAWNTTGAVYTSCTVSVSNPHQGLFERPSFLYIYVCGGSAWRMPWPPWSLDCEASHFYRGYGEWECYVTFTMLISEGQVPRCVTVNCSPQTVYQRLHRDSSNTPSEDFPGLVGTSLSSGKQITSEQANSLTFMTSWGYGLILIGSLSNPLIDQNGKPQAPLIALIVVLAVLLLSYVLLLVSYCIIRQREKRARTKGGSYYRAGERYAPEGLNFEGYLNVRSLEGRKGLNYPFTSSSA